MLPSTRMWRQQTPMYLIRGAYVIRILNLPLSLGPFLTDRFPGAGSEEHEGGAEGQGQVLRFGPRRLGVGTKCKLV